MYNTVNYFHHKRIRAEPRRLDFFCKLTTLVTYPINLTIWRLSTTQNGSMSNLVSYAKARMHMVKINSQWKIQHKSWRNFCQNVAIFTKLFGALHLSEIQKSALHLSTVINFSSDNWTNDFVTSSVRCTLPSGILFCCGTAIQESDKGPVRTAHSEYSRPKCN